MGPDGLRKLALEYLESQRTPETLVAEVFGECATRPASTLYVPEVIFR